MKPLLGHHFSGKIGKDEKIFVRFNIGTNISSLLLSMWKNFVDTFDVTLVSPTGNVYNQYIRVLNPEPYTEDQEIEILIDPAVSGIWVIQIIGINVVDGRFDIWMPTTEEIGVDTKFFSPAPETTLTIPATSEKVISVGGFDSNINAIADFSGRGYTRNNVFVKPDLVAPAVNILTTHSGGGYDVATGTSIAAPFVTGACSLLMEWGIVNKNDPFLYGEKIKAYLKKGAKRDNNVIYPNPLWGYGRLCIKNALDLLTGGIV